MYDDVDKILSSEWVAVDTETDDDEAIPTCKKTLRGVSLAWGNPEHPTGRYWSFEHDAASWRTFKKRILGPLFEREDVKLAWWNYKFDAQVLGTRGLVPKGAIYDGMLLSYLIDENQRHALKACAKRDLGVTTALTYAESQKEVEDIRKRGQKVIKKMTQLGWVLYRDHRKKSKEVEVLRVDSRWPLAKQAAFRLPPGLKKAEVVEAVDKFVRPRVEAIHEARSQELFETYATHDAVWTLQLVWKYLAIVQGEGMEGIFHEVDVPVMDIIQDIERRGVRMDVEILQKLKTIYGAEVKKIKDEIAEDYPDLNPSSPDQLRAIFWGEMEIEPPQWAFSKKNRKKGNLDPVKYASTDKNVLAWLIEEHDNALAKGIVRLRRLEKIKGTYIDDLLDRALADKDHRIHCSFNPVGTVNDRWSSNNPNLQNQPRPGTTENAIGAVYTFPETGEEVEVPSIRRAYIPRDGYKFLNADFSQIELRFLAHVTEDPELLRAYRTWRCHSCGAEGETDTAMHSCPNCWEDEVEAKGHEEVERGFVLGEDIHWQTAVATGLVDHYGPVEGRYKAKNVNFGLIYGMFFKLLAAMIGVPLDVAQEVHTRFFLKYKGVRVFHHWVRHTLEERGWFRLFSGRKRHFTKEWNLYHAGVLDDFQFSKVVREATNSIIQGGAAILMKKVVRDLGRVLRTGEYGDTGIVLQVHDELLIEFPEEREEQVRALVVDKMEHVAQLKVPIITDPEIKMAWSEK